MGNFRIVIDAVGGHGQDRGKKDGEVVDFGATTPESHAAAFVMELKKQGNSVHSAKFIHWPGDYTHVPEKHLIVDDLINGTRQGSFMTEQKYGKLGSFGAAIEAMKKGSRVAREGWNGKGMYLWLLPAAEVKKEWVKDPMLLKVFGEKDTLNCLGSIRMLTAGGEVLTGWLASQSDMLAEDWFLVD
jgi:hypothetical protein